MENDLKNSYKLKTELLGLSSKQQPDAYADVTMKIWALGVTKQHIVSINFLICDHEILEIAYAQKSP